MKLRYNALILFFLAASLLSCEDFLTEDPPGQLVAETFYQNEEEAIAAVNGIYPNLGLGWDNYGRTMQILTMLPTDVMKDGLGMPNQHLQNLSYYAHSSVNQWSESIWQDHYSIIASANSAINNIPNVPEGNINEDLRTRLIGEARFLRALAYFNLVRFYGGVPIITQIERLEDANEPRAPVNEVYNLILDDLEYAQNNLPISYPVSEFGRATEGAAKILEGKVHLTRQNWQESVDKLAEVVENEGQYGYGLHEDYQDNWAPGDERGIEAVFSIDYGKPPLPNNASMMSLQGPKYSLIGSPEAFGIPANEAELPTLELYNEYEEEDSRRYVTLRSEFMGADGEMHGTSHPLFAKYWENGVTSLAEGSVNFHILRYSDAILMYAEALNEIGNTSEAENQLNRILERAFQSTDHNVNGLTQQQFRDKVLHERKLELVDEAHRWFDLVRTGRLVERMQEFGQVESELSEGHHGNYADIITRVSEKHMLFPIPQSEIDKRPDLYEQNPGW
ncbi:RagB/SusD family nutrient uptake outer membrane protein [Fodinibius sp.]|uniref:RagB/SusD family nutrient uptake outer membrane protein n=1 Tax=Fodinibius sp. TaxID=1872440 RepID=UPI00356B30BF